MFWHWRIFTWHELALLIAAGLLANISQLFMSYAYSLAPAGQIGPMNYIAIIFAGIWGFVFGMNYRIYSVLSVYLLFYLRFCSVIHFAEKLLSRFK